MVAKRYEIVFDKSTKSRYKIYFFQQTFNWFKLKTQLTKYKSGNEMFFFLYPIDFFLWFFMTYSNEKGALLAFYQLANTIINVITIFWTIFNYSMLPSIAVPQTFYNVGWHAWGKLPCAILYFPLLNLFLYPLILVLLQFLSKWW